MACNTHGTLGATCNAYNRTSCSMGVHYGCSVCPQLANLDNDHNTKDVLQSTLSRSQFTQCRWWHSNVQLIELTFCHDREPWVPQQAMQIQAKNAKYQTLINTLEDEGWLVHPNHNHCRCAFEAIIHVDTMDALHDQLHIPLNPEMLNLILVNFRFPPSPVLKYASFTPNLKWIWKLQLY